jgi:hypothetical protein
MAYTAYKKITSPKGIAAPWAKLTEPDSYLGGPKKFTVGLIIDPEHEEASNYINALDEQSQAAFDNAIAEMQGQLSEAKGQKIVTLKQAIENMKLHKPYVPEYLDDGQPTGRYIVKYKKNAEGVYGPKHPEAGQKWEASCSIFDANKNPVPKSAGIIQGGSELRVQCEMVPFAMASNNIAGISLRIIAVQVLKMVGGSEACDDFNVEEGGYIAPEASDLSAPEAESLSTDDSDDF